VTYVAGAVSKLLFDKSSGSCYGVSLENGEEFIATKIVLATGANTAKIIADSAPDRKDIQVEDRITGAAVVTGAVRLTDAQMKHYGSMPVFIHRVGESLGVLIYISGGRPQRTPKLPYPSQIHCLCRTILIYLTQATVAARRTLQPQRTS
jgi:hypothetical protein